MSASTSSAPIAVGISGLGRAGWDLHVKALRDLGDQFRIVAACDGLADRREQLAAEFGSRTYETFDQLLRDDEVELLVVAVPSHAHAPQAIQGLEAGKHVLVEKPFATTLDEAKLMFATAASEDRVLLASQNLRFEAGFMKLREIVESGKLGAVIEIRVAWHSFKRRWDWQTVRELGGGVLGNDGTHALDQALLLVEQELPEVFCRLAHTPLSFGDAEDYAKVVLSGPNAPILDLEFTNACAYPSEQWLIMGTQGSLAGGHGKYRAKYVDTRLLAHHEVSQDAAPGRAYNREELPWVEETIDVSSETYTMTHRRLYLALFDAIRSSAPTPVSPESVLRQMTIVEACRRAAGNIMEISS